jgi:hypothetical protein
MGQPALGIAAARHLQYPSGAPEIPRWISITREKSLEAYK